MKVREEKLGYTKHTNVMLHDDDNTMSLVTVWVATRNIMVR